MKHYFVSFAYSLNGNLAGFSHSMLELEEGIFDLKKVEKALEESCSEELGAEAGQVAATVISYQKASKKEYDAYLNG